MRQPKFNFVPERQLKESVSSRGFFHASITKQGALCFGREYQKVYELDNKYARIFLDREKRTLGWKIIEGDTNLDELSDCRKLTPNGTGNMIKVGVSKLLRNLSYEKGDSYKTLPIEIYKMKEGEIHYIIIPETVLDIKNYKQ
jgi:hypothetical protein